MYKSSNDDSVKQMLIETFGIELFHDEQYVLDLLKNGDLEDCSKLTTLPIAKSITDIPESFHKWLINCYHLSIICEAFNCGTKLSYMNTRQRKYYTWFNTGSDIPGGVDFCDADYCVARAVSGDASRLRLKSEQAANAMGKNLNFHKIILGVMED